MLSDARHSQIVKYLETHHSASVQDLARDLYTSPSTIQTGPCPAAPSQKSQ